MPTLEATDTRWLDLDIGPVRVRRAGSGPVLLFVHGVLVDGRLWDDVATRLADRCTVLIPDLPLGAHVRPAHSRELLTPRGVADALPQILDAAGVDRATLVGNDTGGAISQIAAAAHPDRVDHLVLAACDAFDHFPPPAAKPVMWMAYIPGGMRLLGGLLAPWFGRPSPALWPFTARAGDVELWRSWTAPLLTDPRVRADARTLFRAVDPDELVAAAEALRSFAGRALVAWDADDLVFPQRDADRLVATLPDAELVRIAGARALLPLDRPAELAAEIRRFLDSA